MLESPACPISIADFLNKAVEPPVAAAIDTALALLRDIGALTDEGELGCGVWGGGGVLVALGLSSIGVVRDLKARAESTHGNFRNDNIIISYPK